MNDNALLQCKVNARKFELGPCPYYCRPTAPRTIDDLVGFAECRRSAVGMRSATGTAHCNFKLICNMQMRDCRLNHWRVVNLDCHACQQSVGRGVFLGVTGLDTNY